MVSVTTTQPAGLRSFPGRSKHQTLDPRQSLKPSRARTRNETESNPDHFFVFKKKKLLVKRRPKIFFILKNGLIQTTLYSNTKMLRKTTELL